MLQGSNTPPQQQLLQHLQQQYYSQQQQQKQQYLPPDRGPLSETLSSIGMSDLLPGGLGAEGLVQPAPGDESSFEDLTQIISDGIVDMLEQFGNHPEADTHSKDPSSHGVKVEEGGVQLSKSERDLHEWSQHVASPPHSTKITVNMSSRQILMSCQGKGIILTTSLNTISISCTIYK